MLSLELPWPPSINHYWRHTKNGHYISEEGKDYRQLVFFHCLKHKNKFTKEDRISVHIQAHPPDRRKRDLDNVLKALLDSLQHGGIYNDDSQIDRLSISRHLPLEGKVHIMLDVISD